MVLINELRNVDLCDSEGDFNINTFLFKFDCLFYVKYLLLFFWNRSAVENNQRVMRTFYTTAQITSIKISIFV